MDVKDKILKIVGDTSVFDLIPISIYITTMSGDFVFCNTPARQLLELEIKGEIKKKSIEFYRSPKDRQEMIEKLLEKESRGESFQGEILTLVINGEEKYLRDYCRSIRDPETGEVLGLFGCLVDATLEHHYHQLFEHLPAGVYMLDAEDRFTHVNKAVAKIFGYPSPQVLIGKNAKELYVDPEKMAELRSLLMEKGYVEKFIAELIKKDGSTFFASINSFVLKSKDGAYIGRKGTFVDVTMEERFRRNINLAPVGFYEVRNREGNDIITYCNEHFARMHRYENSEEVKEKDIRDFYAHAEELPQFREELRTAYHKGEAIEGKKLKVKRKDGSTFWIRVYCNPIVNRQNEIIGRTGVVIDIEEEEKLRQIEEKLKQDFNLFRSDVGRSLHPFTSSFFQIRQTIDDAIQCLRGLEKKPDHVLGAAELEDFLDEPVGVLARSLSEFMELRKSERGIDALSRHDWDKLASYYQMLILYKEKVKTPEHRPSYFLTIVNEIVKVMSHVKKGYLAKEAQKKLLSGCETLEKTILYIHLRQARDTILRLDYQVQALRDFITRGVRPEEPKKPEFVVDLLEAAIKNLRDYAREHNIEIRIENKYNEAKVYVARREVVRALGNLLHNAIKYSWDPSYRTPEARYVRIQIYRMGNDVCISFENYGVPITKEEIEKGWIFIVGYRGIISHDRDRMGTGIGLADAYEVARSHNGRIEVTSVPASPGLDPQDYSKPFLTTVKFIIPLYDVGG